MLAFLKKIFRSLDKKANDEIFTFYTNFSKAFDKVPQRELLNKIVNMGIGGCLLKVLDD